MTRLTVFWVPKARGSEVQSGDYSERLVADIVLQNGDKMLCVEPLGKHAPKMSPQLVSKCASRPEVGLLWHHFSRMFIVEP